MPVAIPLDCANYLARRRDLLQEKLQAVAESLPRSVEDVRFIGGVLQDRVARCRDAETAEVLANRLCGLLPRIRITDRLNEVAA